MSRLAQSAPIPDWLQPHLTWISLPSWLMSAGLHGALWAVLIVCAQLPGCQPDAPGQGMEELRAIGLMVRPSLEPAGPVSDEPPGVDAEPSAELSLAPAAAAAPEMVPSQPPVDLQLPAPSSPNLLGPGGPPRSVAGVDEILNPSRLAGNTGARGGGGGAGGGGAGGDDGATTFIGIQDSGKRFVYLIDSSSSMADYAALRVAKTELLASLESLSEQQQFQVIFANSAGLTTLDAGRYPLFFGTDSQRLEVRLQIAGIQPDAGTDHRGAILKALDLNPDVLFYLSDAGEPSLLTKDLAEIKRRNRGTRIHTIEFGRGPAGTESHSAANFLAKIAAQNNGRYTYRDVTRFAGR